mgnify:CR=1 FL=1
MGWKVVGAIALSVLCCGATEARADIALSTVVFHELCVVPEPRSAPSIS